ncbi:MAG: LysM peptidoglycan-binding domain-containing protein [Anaerolineae bacterium]
MRRDLGGELLVAVAVVAVLVFALIFGVVLSLSNRTSPAADNGDVTLGAVSNTDGTAPPISHTPTRTLLITPIDTRTPSPAVTRTAAPLIATIAIVTNASPTQVQAVDTIANPSIEAATITSTTAPATTQRVDAQTSTTPPTIPPSTPTATSTVTPTRTMTIADVTMASTTVTPTETPIPVQPSRTSAATSTTPVIVPSAAQTISVVTPTAAIAEMTLEVTPETTAEAGVTECVPTTIGIDYTVTADTSLYAIARSVGTSVYALRRLNCLPINETISVGQMLRIPNAPQIPAATTIPLLLPSDQTYLAQGCSLQNALIVSPLPGETLSGLIDITGTADGERFTSYRIEIRPAARDIYDLYARSTEPISQGLLTLLNTNDYDQGLHYLRLSVLDVSEQVLQSCVIPVIFQ